MHALRCATEKEPVSTGSRWRCRYVGRSVSNLKERIKHGIEDMKSDPTCRYERFIFSYAIRYKKLMKRSAATTMILVAKKVILETKGIPTSLMIMVEIVQFVVSK